MMRTEEHLVLIQCIVWVTRCRYLDRKSMFLVYHLPGLIKLVHPRRAAISISFAC